MLEDRWTKILAAEKYELDSPNQGHTRHNWLPQLEQENHGRAHASLRSKVARSRHEEAPSGLDTKVKNIKTRKLVPSPATLGPLNRQRTTQAYSTEATRWISRVKFTVPREGRQSIPIENAGS